MEEFLWVSGNGQNSQVEKWKGMEQLGEEEWKNSYEYGKMVGAVIEEECKSSYGYMEIDGTVRWRSRKDEFLWVGGE